MKLTGRTILITGGNSGIGLELAAQLLSKNNTVVIAGRSIESLNAARQRYPELSIAQCDVSDPESIDALFDMMAKDFPLIDMIVNNAGIMRALDLRVERPIADVSREIEVNLTGTIHVVQRFLPKLLEQPSSAIINVSSAIAFVPFPISPVYSASKAAIHAYTRCLRVQLEKSTVTVIEIAPPLTETRLYNKEFRDRMSGAKGMAVGDLVRRSIAGIEAGKIEICPGQSGLLRAANRIAPKVVFRQMSKIK